MKSELPAGAIRILKIIAELAEKEDGQPLVSDHSAVAKVLASRGYCELLPGCAKTYVLTDKGRKTLETA